MIIDNEPIEQYRANHALSNSKLSDFLRRPTYYRARHIRKEVDAEETKAMRFGTALHCAVLEPVRFKSAYVLGPMVDRRTKEGKATWAQFIADNPCATVISEDELILLTKMQESVRKHPIASALLAHGKPEVVIRRPSVKFGIEVQCRIDWLGKPHQGLWDAGIEPFTSPYIVDLKSCNTLDDFRGVTDAAGEFRSNHFHRFGYARQQAFYQYVASQEIGIAEFFFIAVEKQPPYDCAVIKVPESYAAAAWEEAADGIERLTDCLRTGHWPSGFEKIQEVKPPRWSEAGKAEAVA